MRVITMRSEIQAVAARWRQQYSKNRPMWRPTTEVPDTDTAAKLLDALDPETATAKDVERIVGNGSWTRVPPCDECRREDTTIVIEVGEPADYDSATARLCPACAEKALWAVLAAAQEDA